MNDREQPPKEPTRFTSLPNRDALWNLEHLWRDQLNRIKHEAEGKLATKKEA